ncbi:hypothetical protein L873DRAFT_1803792 [Choiromyces venosus 120613-1]|uniref:Uncharacterized protein n=1 Tax=Choiromyces venosus 120613-1 TaxID=1336337 RepID=A0A3N4JW96_9PEZI|nr:hypothetical protein L873DRAFT_1803792 [Choiromyces venosus 120613-1]
MHTVNGFAQCKRKITSHNQFRKTKSPNNKSENHNDKSGKKNQSKQKKVQLIPVVQLSMLNSSKYNFPVVFL